MSRPGLSSRIHLNAFAMMCAGHQSPGLWRHPDDQGFRYTDLDHWTGLARLLDDAGFDALFLADVLGIYDVAGGSREAAVRAGIQVPLGDPLMPVSAMAAVTERLGFGLTVSTSYEHPYALARRFTTLDHLTKGRVGWNVVTGYLESAAANLGLGAQLPHDERYAQADEYLEVCRRLWTESWEDDAVVRDAAGGVYTDPAKVHDVDFHGHYYDVPGPFLCEPSPQRSPVIFQAGASPRGLAFAGRHAEAVFVSGPSTAVVAGQVSRLRSAVSDAGRDPASVTVFSQLAPVVAASSAEAHELYASYLEAFSLRGCAGAVRRLDRARPHRHRPRRAAALRRVRRRPVGARLVHHRRPLAGVDGGGGRAPPRGRRPGSGGGGLGRGGRRRDGGVGRRDRRRRAQPRLRRHPGLVRAGRGVRGAGAAAPGADAGDAGGGDAAGPARRALRRVSPAGSAGSPGTRRRPGARRR